MTNHILKCAQCDKIFNRKKIYKTKNVFCSVQCNGLWNRKNDASKISEKKSYNRTPNCKCVVCCKEVYRRPAQIDAGNVYCSQACKGKYTQKGRGACKICNKEIAQIGKSGSRRWSTYCSRSCANKGRTGSKYKQDVSHSKYQHSQDLKSLLVSLRGPKCERCPCNMVGILHCHHIVEVSNGGGDEPENLMLLCPNCHYTEHHGFMTWEDYFF